MILFDRLLPPNNIIEWEKRKEQRGVKENRDGCKVTVDLYSLLGFSMVFILLREHSNGGR